MAQGFFSEVTPHSLWSLGSYERVVSHVIVRIRTKNRLESLGIVSWKQSKNPKNQASRNRMTTIATCHPKPRISSPTLINSLESNFFPKTYKGGG
jgi:hypothetical protein